MKQRSLIIVSLITFLFSFLFLAWAQDAKPAVNAKYVGTDMCKMCHQQKRGKQYLKWEKGPHAQAYKSLSSDKAKEMAKALNVDDPTNSEKCLKCHITTDQFTSEKQRSEGVGCEHCHGPSSVHIKAAMKTDYVSSPANEGRNVFEGKTEEETMANIEKHCRQCHGLEHKDENPAAKEFVFKDRWPKIKHDEETLKKEFPEAYK